MHSRSLSLALLSLLAASGCYASGALESTAPSEGSSWDA